VLGSDRRSEPNTYNYPYGNTFPAFPFSPATATVATERQNGNGMVETSHNADARWSDRRIYLTIDADAQPPQHQQCYNGHNLPIFMWAQCIFSAQKYSSYVWL